MDTLIKLFRTANSPRRSGLQIFRISVELFFLALFIVLSALGRVESWIVVFGLGCILSLFFGRIYCAWACPMATLFRPIGWLYRKLGLRRLSGSRLLGKPYMRYVFLALMLASMAATKRMGIHVPLLAIVVGISVLVTLFFEEVLWHNRLCPYGTILHGLARFSRMKMGIREDACISCGKCQKVCPSQAISTEPSKKRLLHFQDCLVCTECVGVCPTNAIGYGASGPSLFEHGPFGRR